MASRFLTGLAGLALLAGCASAPPAFRAPDGAARPLRQIDATLLRLMDAASVPGLALALIENGQVVHKRAYGMATLSAGVPMRTDTIMYGASLTKAAFAYLVMQLAEEKLLSLDLPLTRQLRQPLPDYPGFADLRTDPRWEQFTPRMLLSHSAGMLNWRWINEDKKLTINFEPGSRYVYSGEGIQVLQLLVEERSGRALGDLMQERVFDRFGMRHTSMRWRADFAGRETSHYGAQGELLPHQRRKNARAAGSMDTTLDDMALFFAGVLRGEGLSPASMDLMLSPQLAIVSPQQFPSHWPGETTLNRGIGLAAGLGWPVFTSPYGPAFFKEGSDDGTNNLMLGFRRQRSGIVMLSNSTNATKLFHPAVEAAFGRTCLPWFWMGYIPWDRPALRGLAARDAPVVSPGC